MTSPSHDDTSNNKKSVYFLLLITLMLALGGAMRFHALGEKSFWADELFTLRMALYHPLIPADGSPWFERVTTWDIGEGQTFWTAKAAEQSPPLQDLLEKGSVNLFGFNDWSPRVPGAVASCLLLLWFAWFAYRSKTPWERGVLTWSLWLLTLSPVLVIYAHDARAYSLGASLLGMAGLPWLLRWRHGWRSWVAPGWGEIVLFTLASYAHYNAAVLVVLMLGVDFVMTVKTRSATSMKRLLVPIVGFSLWLVANAHTILFTTKGGVSWGARSTMGYVLSAVTDFTATQHLPWVVCFIALATLIFAMHAFLQPRQALSDDGYRVFFLLCLSVVFMGLAGAVAAKAGMAHPRYYIFVVPVFVVMFSIVLQKLKGPILIGMAAVGVSLLAVPGMRSESLVSYEEFRGMTAFAVQNSDEKTVFLFPWEPNRDMYRVYLERMLERDSRSQMLGISFPQQVPEICEKLKDVAHVSVVAHASGHDRVNEIYAACGRNWPIRELGDFHNTFSEHWRKQPVSTRTGS